MTQSWERVTDPMIFDRYAEPQRHYHTTQHIAEMFKLYDERFKDSPYLSEDQHTALYFAIWFHDAVYEPEMGDNEYRSALLVRREMDAKGLPQRMIDDAVRLVLSTRDHDPKSMDEKILSDLDLAILGAEHERYKEYVDQVRQEFAFVPDEVWADLWNPRARPAIVQGFLDRDRIFFYLTDREQQARNNLAWELMQYEGHP